MTAADTSRGILIKLRDPQALARSQGAIASAATTIAPETIVTKVHDEFASQMRSTLADKGIDADVSIVVPKGFTAIDDGVFDADLDRFLARAGIVAGVVWLGIKVMKKWRRA